MRTVLAGDEREADRDDAEDEGHSHASPGDSQGSSLRRALVPVWRWAGVAAVPSALVVGIVARFVVRSPLWLDEALTVNIASLSLGDLLEALRHDGHPPLYYVVLHYWMELFGEGDVAVRALSGLFAVAALPLAWVAGRRHAGQMGARWTLVLVALSPFWIRYATEARMYSMVMLIVLAGYLLLPDTLTQPRMWRVAGLAVLSGLLLLTHYWSFWLIAAVGLMLLWRWWRWTEERRATGLALIGVAGGGLLFLPWLPGFLYQAQHTGTPWAGPMRPLAIVWETFYGMGGGGNLTEAFAYAFLVLILLMAALFVIKASGSQITLELRTVEGVRAALVVSGLTMAIGCVTAYLSSSTFQSRYAAVFMPMLLIAAAVGLTRLPERARLVAGLSLVGMSMIGIGWVYWYQRTASGVIGPAIENRAQPGDVVVYCPDQLGPGYSREVNDAEGVEQVSYPTMEGPAFVDWVDYQERNADAKPKEFAQEIREMAGDHYIFMVWLGGYNTLEGQCEKLEKALRAGGRENFILYPADESVYYEPAHLEVIYPPEGEAQDQDLGTP